MVDNSCDNNINKRSKKIIMGLTKFLLSIAMVVLFSIAILNYATDFGSDNNIAYSVGNDSEISTAKTNLESQTRSYALQVNSTSQAFQEQKIESGDETTQTGGTIKSLSSYYSSTKEILNLVRVKIFGGEDGSSGFGIMITAVTTMLVIFIILLVWKTWAGKNPE